VKNVGCNDPDFGKNFECPNRSKVVWDENIGISETEAPGVNWHDYKNTAGMVAMRRAYTEVLKQGYGMVYVHGDPGNGKTIAVKSAVVCAVKQYSIPRSKYTRQSEFMNYLRESYALDDGQAVYRERLSYYSKMQLLAMDEIGRDRMTDFAMQSFSELLDARYQMAIRKQGITFWVSNFAPEKVLEPYQVDRITDGRFRVIEVKGTSIRPTMKYQEVELDQWWDK